MVTPTTVLVYLNDLTFPATKDEIVEHAEERNAPDEVVGALAAMPDGVYECLADVWAVTGMPG